MLVRGSVPLLALLLWTLPVSGQSIRALVLDPDTRIPVGGGYVVLWTADGDEVARVLNAEDGLVALTAPGPGRYRAAVERAGFETIPSDPFTVEAGRPADIELEFPHHRVDLAGMAARAGSACMSPADDADGVGLLWHEARKVLAATEWSGAEPYQYHTVLSRRDLDLEGQRVVAESTQVVRGTLLRPAAGTAIDAFVVSQPGGGTAFNPPGPDLLLDGAFLRVFCLQMVRNADRMGLTFRRREPTDAPDVTGVLWFDPGTGQLRQLEYRFLNTPLAAGADLAGGTLDFLAGPADRWMTARWSLRMPLLGRTEGGETVVAGVRHVGGSVGAVSRGAEVLYEAHFAELVGMVADSGGAPLAGAEVVLVGTDYRADAGTDGRFRIAGPLDGEYQVAFAHPRLDAQGLFPPDTTVVIRPGEAISISLRAVPATDLLSPLMESAADRAAEANRPLRSRNVIPYERIIEAQDLTALELVRRLRPDWFRYRGTTRFTGETGDPVVFRNGKYIGTADVLGSISLREVREIRYYDRDDATQRWGSRFGRPVIEVLDRR